MPTISELRQQAATIKNATQVGENTATRVGTTFETIADLLEGMGGVANVSTIDIGEIDTLNTAGDMLASSPNIYTLTDTIGGNTFKVGTLFLFANNGYYDVAQVVVSQFFVENGRIDTSSSDDKVHVYYRFCRTRNTGSLPTPVGTWTTWTEFSGEGGGSPVTIDTYPTENSANAVSSGGAFERLADVSPKVDINALDDIDEYSDMLATKSPFYTVTKTMSSVLFRIGTLMVFANQGRYILYQILATDYLLNDDGTLDTTTSINGGLKLIWRMKQFSGNPPAGVTIGVWSAWSYLSGGGAQPDNEDIDLNANDQLQFANKAYDASAFSGLGRVYLRKNIVTLEGTGKNVLTQAMVNTANTIYHIQYDYDLNGQTITLPAGCVLEFDGGSLANGIIVGNDTTIQYGLYTCFTNVTMRGTYANDVIDCRVFGIFPNVREDATPIMYRVQKESSIGLYFTAGNYYLSELYVNWNKFKIVGEERGSLTPVVFFYNYNSSQYYIIKLGGLEHSLNEGTYVRAARIENITFSTPTIQPLELSVDENIGLTYPYAALVIDKCDTSYFAISGYHFNNIPLISLGYSWENYFSSIISYGTGEHPVDCPIIQIHIPQSVGYISATIINRLMVETYASPIFSGCDNSAISEMQINNMLVECAVQWLDGVENVVAVDTSSINYDDYVKIPFFKCTGIWNINIQTLTITLMDRTWNFVGDEDTYIFAFAEFSGNLSTRINIANGSCSNALYVFGIANNQYNNYILAPTFELNCKPNNTSSLVVEGTLIGNKPVVLADNYTYIGEELTALARFEKRNSVLLGYAATNEQTGRRCVITKTGTYPIGNSYGFVVNKDYLNIEYFHNVSGYRRIAVEYYDKNGNLLSTQAAERFIVANGNVNRISLYLQKPSGYAYLKLIKDESVAPYDYFPLLSIAAVDQSLCFIKKGNTASRPTSVGSGYEYYDTSLKKNILWNGSKWIENDGATAGVKRNGTSTERPASADIYIGFKYFDTTLNKALWWNGSIWVDGTGVPASDSLKLLPISQNDYDALSTKDSDTLYVIS